MKGVYCTIHPTHPARGVIALYGVPQYYTKNSKGFKIVKIGYSATWNNVCYIHIHLSFLPSTAWHHSHIAEKTAAKLEKNTAKNRRKIAK